MSTIKIELDRETAKEFRWALPSMAHAYDGETSSGTSMYYCQFCSSFAYGDKRIKHTEDCIADKLEAAFDAALSP